MRATGPKAAERLSGLRERIRRSPLALMAIQSVMDLARRLMAVPWFFRSLYQFRRLRRGREGAWRWGGLYPCLTDRSSTTGFDRHYILHTAWAARVLAASRPSVHHDVSSALFFSTIASAFIPIRFFDLRPAQVRLQGLETGSADLTQLPFQSNSIESLSCMHVVEHVGLGRYGDPVDPDADQKVIQELQRVVRPGGQLLFVVPIGAQAQILFNAHRIYTVDQVHDAFSHAFDLREFCLIPEKSVDGELVEHPSPDLLARQYYACGCFWWVKKRL